LIIGGRSFRSIGESGANLISGRNAIAGRRGSIGDPFGGEKRRKKA
jgi:hypothetical protein